ncbi:molybdenum ABC transporter substrate-binding protein [Rhodoplanes elegans]|uniref:Molybdenum ABC transporter substrate-binding protein n=1 Tax=Rhodoplanes elegans TaxID=29408 RepID=A0A327KFS4_9BRAD|nr:substrate-binding domain-containing protein [Rhodoplanes elegans]MBK5957361.1 molybdenum ABC transporter substrate-binding protein [Rhodoplanes elegans]RAI36483.1 molybdenum ABC transporter substrate-binding protein [Rhodoplanes elegans]
MLIVSRLFATRVAATVVAAPLLAALAATSPSTAADVKVLTTGAFKPIVVETVAPFEKATGHKVEVVNDTAGALVRRVEGGESFDVIVLTPGGLKGLAEKGRVAAGPPVPLARVGIGVAVASGAPKPDIATVESFKTALLGARRVAMIDPASGGSSGIYLTKLFEQWGIADAVKAKAVLVPGGLVATKVVSGEADLALHQVSEILAVKDAVLVGALPPEIQNYTVYAGGLSPSPRDPVAAKAFLSVLASPEAAKRLEQKGMLPPGP